MDGRKVTELARHFKVKNQKVSEVLRRRGVPLRPGGVIHEKFATLTQCEELADEYRKVGNVHVLAELHGVSPPTIIGALTRAGQPLNKPGSASIWTDATIDRAVEMFRLGVPINLIAQAIGTTYGAVRARLYERKELGRAWGAGPGERTDSGEYVFVMMQPGDEQYVTPTSNGQVAEHRLIMGRKLGRPLTPDETVHHINGRRNDNREENLQLRRGHHGAGQALQCGDCGSHNVVSVPLAEPAG